MHKILYPGVSNHAAHLGTPSLWPEEEHLLAAPPLWTPQSSIIGLTERQQTKRKYLNKYYLPQGWPVEGIEEFPINLPYDGCIPDFLVGTSVKHEGFHPYVGLHNFTFDDTNERLWKNIDRLIKMARHYGCVCGLDFSPLINARRCEVIEAIRRIRTSTACLQACGFNVIQNATFGHPKHNHFVHDGLAPNAPVAIEHMRTRKDAKLRKYFRKGVESLVEQKNPSVLLVLGFPMDFDPGVPVKYYPCHIQKLRAL